MRLVNIESPYAAGDAGDIEANLTYARACLADCLRRNESPACSHLLFTQPGVLDDTIPHERALGIQAGFAWNAHAAATVVYTDRGISTGMRLGIAAAEQAGRPVEYRSLPSG